MSDIKCESLTPQEAIEQLKILDTDATEFEAMDFVNGICFGDITLDYMREFMVLYQQNEFRFQTCLSLTMNVAQMSEPVCDLKAFGEYVKAAGLRNGLDEAWLDKHVIETWTHRDYTKQSAMSSLLGSLQAAKKEATT